MTGAVSDDTLMGGRVRLRQPRGGYRVAIDPVLLAASVPARAGELVLDAGTGTGAAALCLAARVAGVGVVGLELFAAHAELARANLVLNHASDRIEIVEGDIARPPPALAPGSFDHVMANPPHHEPGAVRPSPDPGRAAAHVEGEAKLADWVGACLALARPGASVTFIHRAGRVAELVAELARGAGAIVVLPLLPRQGQAAKRVLVQARAGAAQNGAEAVGPAQNGAGPGNSPARTLPGLVLHDADGAYTDAAEAILRGGGALALDG